MAFPASSHRPLSVHRKRRRGVRPWMTMQEGGGLLHVRPGLRPWSGLTPAEKPDKEHAADQPGHDADGHVLRRGDGAGQDVGP